MDACARLVATLERLAGETSDPREFLLRLGTEAAGIRRGPHGLADLARGGRNVLPGGDVRDKLDDDTGGQIRHFAGIATASARVGPTMARLLSIVIGRDAPTSADGRLTALATSFARRVLRRELALTDAGAWVDRYFCA